MSIIYKQIFQKITSTICTLIYSSEVVFLKGRLPVRLCFCQTKALFAYKFQVLVLYRVVGGDGGGWFLGVGSGELGMSLAKIKKSKERLFK